MTDFTAPSQRYLLVSDFDQTLSFHDSGHVLAELAGIDNFGQRVAGLSDIHLVQQGGELAYLLLHDPEYRKVRREHLIEAGRRIRLKANIPRLIELLAGIEGREFSCYVVSAAPEEIVQSALEGVVASDHIFGTRFRYDARSGEIASIVRLPAGYGKVAVVEELRANLGIAQDRIVYVGDGSSDLHVMLHVNHIGGLTIAVSENRYIREVARRTIVSDDALTVLVPVLEDVLGWNSSRIRSFFAANGFAVHEWEKVRTDTITLSAAEIDPAAKSAAV